MTTISPELLAFLQSSWVKVTVKVKYLTADLLAIKPGQGHSEG